MVRAGKWLITAPVLNSGSHDGAATAESASSAEARCLFGSVEAPNRKAILLRVTGLCYAHTKRRIPFARVR